METPNSHDEHRARALRKLRKELAKDIGKAVGIARTCGLWDLLRFCYLLRFNRVLMVVPAYRDRHTAASLAGLHLRDESLKYAIALVAKHGGMVTRSERHGHVCIL
jgi:hypothetical protein